jgi:hypothetical protein
MKKLQTVPLQKSLVSTGVAMALALVFSTLTCLPVMAVPEAGQVLRLDASALELDDGAPVSLWTDLSGAGNHALQEDPSRTPVFVASGSVFGMPVIRFSGGAPLPHLLVENMGPHDPPYTIFLVWKINQNPGGDQNALDGVPDGERVRIGYQGNPGRLFAFSGGSFPNLEKMMPAPFENLLMATVVYDPSGGLLRLNGVLEHENVTGSTPIMGFTIGRRTTTETQALVGDIAELIVYNRRLSEAEIGEVETYLDAKWLRDAGDTTPPTVPQNLTVNAGAVFAHLSWDPSTDDSGEVVYDVQRDGQIIATSVSGASYVDQSVSPTTSYTYRVQASDLSRNLSEPSASVQATTKALSQVNGLVKAEFYTGISGIKVTDLVAAAKFPDSPDATSFLPVFETPVDFGKSTL